MSDLIPSSERIKAWNWNGKKNSGQWHVSGVGHTQEYVRADLVDSQTAALRAENERLREALQEVEQWWLNEGKHQNMGAPYAIFAVRAALSPTDGEG